MMVNVEPHMKNIIANKLDDTMAPVHLYVMLTDFVHSEFWPGLPKNNIIALLLFPVIYPQTTV